MPFVDSMNWSASYYSGRLYCYPGSSFSGGAGVILLHSKVEGFCFVFFFLNNILHHLFSLEPDAVLTEWENVTRRRFVDRKLTFSRRFLTGLKTTRAERPSVSAAW